MLDLRIPSGLFFTATGLILVVMGFTVPADPTLLSQANVNLYAGTGILGFGAILLLLSRFRP